MACPSADQLARFVDGVLVAGESDAVEAHMDTCAPCRQTVSAAARRGGGERAVDEAREPGPGDRVGRYELRSLLGAGAMGVVFAARDPELDRRVAVKLLGGAGGPRGHAREERLAREARALARISHPNVVPVHDVGTAAGDRVFIAMELVDGKTLRVHVAEDAPGPRRRVDLIVQAGRGLAAAHAAGVIHRDFKPDNVLVGRDGRVRVGDFGLAAADASADGGDGANDDVRITRSGAMVGTPAYMAPELLRGEPATAASDQFALCVTAWEIVFGRRPFAGATPAELAAATERGPAAIADPPGGRRRLVAALRRGLAADPARRHPDVAAAVAAIEHAMRIPRVPFVAGAGALAVAGVVWIVAARPASDASPCARAGDRVAQVWSPARRAALTAALAGAPSPIAAETAAATVRAVDRVAARWSAAATEHCAAFRQGWRSAELYDRQVACLDGRKGELAVLLDVLARGDAATAERAVSAVAALGDVDACATPAARPALPPAQAAEVERARAVVAEGKALRRTGRYDAAVATLTPIAAVPDPALAAEVELELGMAANALGELAVARDHLSRAVARADEARDDVARARALLEAIMLVGDEVVDLDEGQRLADQATAAVARAGGAPLLRADLAVAIGRLQLRRGDARAASASIDQAIVAYRAADPVDELRLANALNTGAHGRLMVGDHAAGLAMLEEARAVIEPALGPHHPHVAATVTNMIGPLYFLDRTADALAAAEHAVAIYEAAFGPDHARVALALDNLANVHAMAGRPADALPIYDRVIAILTARLGADHVDVATALLNRASALAELDRLDAAAESYARVVAIWEPALGDHLDLARALSALGDVERRRGGPARAVALLERAVSIMERRDPDPDHLATARFRLARALRDAGRSPGRAAALARAAQTHWAQTDAAESAEEVAAWLAVR